MQRKGKKRLVHQFAKPRLMRPSLCLHPLCCEPAGKQQRGEELQCEAETLLPCTAVHLEHELINGMLDLQCAAHGLQLKGKDAS